MNAWLSAPRRSFNFSIAGKVLEIRAQLPRCRGLWPLSGKPFCSGRTPRGDSQRRLRPPPPYLFFFFQKTWRTAVDSTTNQLHNFPGRKRVSTLGDE